MIGDETKPMPSSLHLLSSCTIRSIASSQVITSVSCVVKELIENSLDAGATNIEVKLDEWGLSRIEVRDNGNGITGKDVPFVAQPHYTSKLTSDKDLEKLTTYGFRGEALSALCALSNVTLLTKTPSDPVAVSYTLDSCGKIAASKPSPASCGTTITACNLFKNMPVRKQFYGNLKKCKEELKKVEDLVIAFGLIHPQLRILLKHNKSITWQKSQVSNHRTALISVFGASTFSQMEQLHYLDQQNDCSLEIMAYLPKAGSNVNVTSRVTSDRCFMYVNERPVVLKKVLQLVREYYSSNAQATANRYPIMMLSIKVPPDTVDVNLEPNKNTVLLKEIDYVLKVLTELLEEHYSVRKVDSLHEPKTRGTRGNKITELCSDPALSDDENLHSNIDRVVECTSDMCCDAMVNSTSTSGLCMRENNHTVDHDSMMENGKDLEKSSTTLDSETPQSSRSPTRNKKSGGNANGGSSQEEHFDLKETAKNCQEDWADDLFDDISDIELSIPSNLFSPLSSPVVETFSQENLKTSTPSGDVNIIEPATVERGEFCQLEALNNNHVSVIKSRDKFDKNEKFKDHNEKEEKQKTCENDKLCISVCENQSVVDNPELPSDPCSARKMSGKGSSEEEFENPSLDEWSYGCALVDKQGKTLEPVHLLQPPPPTSIPGSLEKRKSLSVKRKHSTSNNQLPFKSTSPSKKIKTVAKIVNQPLITTQLKPASSPEERRELMPTSVVHFNIQQLKKTYNQMKHSRSPRQENLCLQLICRLEPWGLWLAKKNDVINCVNQYRIQECVLFHRLMKTYSFQREKLEKCIQLNESLVGGSEAFSILYNMEHETHPPDPSSYIVDKRLTENGFDVRRKIDAETGQVKLELYGMTTDLPFYGVSDLAQLIGMIKDSVSSKNNRCLSQCRPLKVVNFLKGEAVRLARKLGTRMSSEEVKEILEHMSENLPCGTDACIHGRPFFHTLAKIPTC